MGKQDRSREALRTFEQRRRELEQLHLEHDLVDSTAPFLADPEAPHERGERLVAGAGWRVHEALGVDQGFARVRDLDAIVEDFDHRARTGHEEVALESGPRVDGVDRAGVGLDGLQDGPLLLVPRIPVIRRGNNNDRVDG